MEGHWSSMRHRRAGEKRKSISVDEMDRPPLRFSEEVR